ncbi:hypothetical protein D9758_004992 [Tetrapyrgos nigripes]|uniref:Uncharacterized protein n=1 Tax=Tetrapyrgos nigripes TaxID=182062 RepID=A0A8H5GWB9_9AGAR|nr:hypothetical protein D9758_004992 [Tetrapyrgos nigripes]
MTRSNQSQYSPKVAKKAFRQSARASGLTYPQAIATLKAAQASEREFRRNGGGGFDVSGTGAGFTKASSESAFLKNIKTTNPQHWQKLPYSLGLSHSRNENAVAVGLGTTTRRNPGRMDGVSWNGNSFICPKQVDKVDMFESGNRNLDAEDKVLHDVLKYSMGDDVDGKQKRTLDLAALIDAASARGPKKAKGLAHKLEYEILTPGPTRRVIFLNDNDVDDDISELALSDLGLEDWEDLYYDDDDFSGPRSQTAFKAKGMEKMSYAAVLKTNG